MITRQVVFSAPTPLLSVNQRVHWSKRARVTKEWRAAAHWGVRRLGTSADYRDLPPCRVLVELPVPDRRRRDPHNYTSTIVKAIVDGLVDAGCWPDDTPEFVTVDEPRLIPGARSVYVHLIERQEP